MAHTHTKRQKTEECSNCEGSAKVVRGDYFWEDIDLPVLLKNIQLIKCDACGTVEPIIPRLSQVMRVLALAVILKPYRLTGAELRFLRKFIGQSGVEFSKLIKIDKSTLSKWENSDDPIGEQSDRLIRAVALGLGDGLHSELRNLVEHLPNISHDVRPVKIEMDPERMSYEYAA